MWPDELPSTPSQFPQSRYIQPLYLWVFGFFMAPHFMLEKHCVKVPALYGDIEHAGPCLSKPLIFGSDGLQ